MSKRGPFIPPSKEQYMQPILAKNDSREWFFTGQYMYNGKLHARLYYIDSRTNRYRKKLVPMEDISFLAR